MIFSRKQTCPKCDAKASPEAKFCPECGQGLAGGVLACGSCGTENRANARFCKQCGREMAESAAPELHRNRWARREDDFAVRVEADDLSGFMRSPLIIDPGVNALLIEKGAVVATAAPGEYELDTLGGLLKEWFSGRIPERLTALLVDITPTEFEFHMGGIFTKDPHKIGATVRLQTQVNEPGKFLVNMLKGRERLSKEYVRQFLYPEVTQVATRWIRQYSVDQLTDDLNLKDKFELALEEALKETFSQNGLEFLNVRVLELNLEPLEQVKSIKSKYALQVSEKEAEAKGLLTLADAMRKHDLAEVADETREVEKEEQLVALYQRMREAVMSDRMNEVRSTDEFEAFLNENDLGKLLREKERKELLRTWEEESEDHDIGRAHLLAKLDVERAYELRMIEFKQAVEYDQAALDHEISMARKRSDFEWDQKRKTIDEEFYLERERMRIASEKRKAEIELQRLQREEDKADAQVSMQILAQMKEIKRLDKEESLRIEREHELAVLRARQDLEIEMMDARERQLAGERQFELDRLEKMGHLGAEALIATSSSEQGRIIADLKKTEALQGMSEDQILAAAAKDSPEVARAIQEKFRAIAEGQANQETAEMYERLLAERQASLQRTQDDADKRVEDVAEAWDKSSARQQQTTDRAMDRMSDTAQAFARGQGGTPVVITGSGTGGPQVVSSDGSVATPQPTAEPQKNCPNCALPVPADANFCEHCGHKFEGV
jgi:membrane protease subunit (stomatin/prohibitin family)